MEKNLIVNIDGENWNLYLIKTHFIGVNDSFEDIVKKYVLSLATDNDIVILCQKIVSIIQKRIIYKKDIKVGFFANFLSKFVKKTPYGFSVGNPFSMEVSMIVKKTGPVEIARMRPKRIASQII